MWTGTLKFSIDWVTLRVDCPNWNTFIDGFCSICNITDDLIIPCRPRNFYDYSYTVSSAGHSIVFSHSSAPEFLPQIHTSYSDECTQYGISVNISGDGCRWIDDIQENALCTFLRFCSQWNCNCTRMDVAMDIFEKNNPIYSTFERFFNDVGSDQRGHVDVCSLLRRSSGWISMTTNYDEQLREWSNNYVIGKRTACGMAVLYNKKLETLNGRLSHIAEELFDALGVTDYWYRLEYRALNARLGNQCFNLAITSNSAEEVFSFMVDELFTFVSAIYDVSHLGHCPVDQEWADFKAWLAREVGEPLVVNCNLV